MINTYEIVQLLLRRIQVEHQDQDLLVGHQEDKNLRLSLTNNSTATCQTVQGHLLLHRHLVRGLGQETMANHVADADG